MTLPKAGATLEHVGTYAMAAEGQAVDWDESGPGHFWGITRKGGEMIEMRLPLGRQVALLP
ncbi:hypothetical protein [Novosphingobium sp. 9U]|uniref:hypothetical protein n=1 Tax=Novosphingobium sp. 9U TaxID=2653158 RepID=UPI0012F006DC|nr:hypothetical protein [Novosphingobium sp. 9U]VWX51296.1 hypothetical protein NOVOSPHI9U_40056 [Novosphingobium sp. 9U]